MPDHRARILLVLGALAVPLAAWAGEADFNESDIAEFGTPYFGEAKDIKGLTPIEGVRFKAQLKGTQRFFLISTDDEGHFRRNGLGTDVNSDNVEVTCEKEGYRTVDLLRRRTSDKRNAPVEVECLMEKAK
jgi:hypothetical protein